MKKFISAFLAAVAISAAFAAPVFAEETNNSVQDATYCFDNSNSLTQWQTYGSTDTTGLKLSITTDKKVSGDGSLCVSENITTEIAADSQFGGVYISADSLDLEDFKGCTVQMSVRFDENVLEVADKFTAFSDGIVWITAEAPVTEKSEWTTLSLTVPSNAANTKIGFTIPVFEAYSGNVVYIDNLTVYDANGTAIANIGDSQLTSDGITVSIDSSGRVILTVVLVILILAVIGGIGFIVSTFLKRFT